MRLYLQLGRICSQNHPDETLKLGNSPMDALDRTDIAILRLLQRDASASISAIADSVHLSQNACWRRIKRLEEDGVIRKRVALLDPQLLGVGVTVFVSVRAAEHTEKWLESFTTAVPRPSARVGFLSIAGGGAYFV